jgi:hypothetical protein
MTLEFGEATGLFKKVLTRFERCEAMKLVFHASFKSSRWRSGYGFVVCYLQYQGMARPKERQ